MLGAPLQRGVSLIELLIGIAIVGILMAAGFPSYRAWIQNTQIRNAAESVLNGMQLARSEAVRRNTNVQLVFGTASSWTVSVVSPAQQIQARGSGEGSSNVTATILPAGATTVTFNPLGRVVPAAASITEVELTVPTAILAAAEARKLRIVIGAGGNVRMCDPAVSDTSDPRKCPS